MKKDFVEIVEQNFQKVQFITFVLSAKRKEKEHQNQKKFVIDVMNNQHYQTRKIVRNVWI